MNRQFLKAGLACLALAAAGAPLSAQPGKPEQPVLPPSFIQGLAPADCAKDEIRPRVAADMRKGMPSVMAYVSTASAYSTQLMEWKAGRLRRGGWTKDDERKFGLAVLASEKFSGELQLGMGELEGLMTALQSLDEKDDKAMCEAAFIVQSRFDGIVRHTMAQWKMISDALDAEGKRLGVSFD